MTRFPKMGLIVLAVSVAALAGASAARAEPGLTTLVSIASTGEQVMGAGSQQPSVSADGRFVTFITDASNVVPGDTNFAFDAFVRDRLTNETTRVSVSSTGAEGDQGGGATAISADGRFVAFTSGSTNLVAGDTNETSDAFVHDRLTGVTERVSVSSTGAEGNLGSGATSISADGRFVAFVSYATNLVDGDTNNTLDAFVHDRVTGVTDRVSVSSTGEQADRFSEGAAISADARFVAFSAVATNLVVGDTNGTVDAFVRDRASGTTERVSVSTAGAQANERCDLPSISADGTRVAFQSLSTTLVERDTNGLDDIFVHDLTTGETRRVSVFTPSPFSPGLQGNGSSQNAAMSADGTLVAFDSNARLVQPDTNGWRDVFAHELG